MKVLASYPLRLATVGELKRDLRILVSGGSDWARLTSKMADALPGLDIFSLGFVERYSFGWRLSDRGFRALKTMQTHARMTCSGSMAREGPSEHTLAEASVLDVAVGQTDGFPLEVRSHATPAERRRRFTVIQGGKS